MSSLSFLGLSSVLDGSLLLVMGFSLELLLKLGFLCSEGVKSIKNSLVSEGVSLSSEKLWI